MATTKELTEYAEEIERLNKQIEEYQKALDETTSEKIDLDNIIKEVREYITYARTPRTIYESGYGKGTCVEICMEHLLEILDKENK